MRKRSRLAAAVCGILLGLVVLAGCAQAPGPSAGASLSGSPGGTVSGEPQPSASQPGPSPTPRLEPVPTGKPTSGKSSAIQLTGRLVEGVERCTILRTDDGHNYEMYGQTPLPPIGTRVRVKGVVRTDIMSFCMQGPIVEVFEIERV